MPLKLGAEIITNKIIKNNKVIKIKYFTTTHTK